MAQKQFRVVAPFHLQCRTPVEGGGFSKSRLHRRQERAVGKIIEVEEFDEGVQRLVNSNPPALVPVEAEKPKRRGRPRGSKNSIPADTTETTEDMLAGTAGA